MRGGNIDERDSIKSEGMIEKRFHREKIASREGCGVLYFDVFLEERKREGKRERFGRKMRNDSLTIFGFGGLF